MLLPLRRSPSSSTNMGHIFILPAPTRQLRHHRTAKETINLRWQEVLLHPHGKASPLPQPREVQETPWRDSSSSMAIPWITQTASLCLPGPWGAPHPSCKVPVLPLTEAVLTHTNQQGLLSWVLAAEGRADQNKTSLVFSQKVETRLVFSQKDETRFASSQKDVTRP